MNSINPKSMFTLIFKHFNWPEINCIVASHGIRLVLSCLARLMDSDVSGLALIVTWLSSSWWLYFWTNFVVLRTWIDQNQLFVRLSQFLPYMFSYTFDNRVNKKEQVLCAFELISTSYFFVNLNQFIFFLVSTMIARVPPEMLCVHQYLIYFFVVQAKSLLCKRISLLIIYLFYHVSIACLF